jgi:geranylgeranyl diphosphate synthase type I
VVAAHQLADGSARRQLRELMASDRLDEAALDRLRTLIVATGAVQRIEELITSRVQEARNALDRGMVDHPVTAALLDMAGLCTQRAA